MNIYTMTLGDTKKLKVRDMGYFWDAVGKVRSEQAHIQFRKKRSFPTWRNATYNLIKVQQWKRLSKKLS